MPLATLARWCVSYAVPIPDELQVLPQFDNGTNGTNGITARVNTDENAISAVNAVSAVNAETPSTPIARTEPKRVEPSQADIQAYLDNHPNSIKADAVRTILQGQEYATEPVREVFEI